MFRLKELRESRGLSKATIASDLNISRQFYGYYESGERSPNLDMLITLADYFEVSTDYLLCHEPKGKEKSLSPLEKLHIKKYLQLDIEGKAAVDNVLDFEFSKISRKERAIQNAVI